MSLARGDATPLRDALDALPEIPPDCQWANFVRDHDELTLDKLAEDERQEVFAAFGPDPDLQLYGRGLRRRVPTMLGGDERRMRMLYSLAFALPGTPVLFYGEEIGMAENLQIPGRYSVRAPMQWSAEAHGGFSTTPDAGALCRPVVDADGWAPERVNVAAQRRADGSLLNWMERLIRRRRECPELGWGRCTLLDAGHDAVLAHRADWDGSTILAVHSFADTRLEAHLQLEPDIEEAVDLLAHVARAPDQAGAVQLGLEPYGYRWSRLRRRGQRIAPSSEDCGSRSGRIDVRHRPFGGGRAATEADDSCTEAPGRAEGSSSGRRRRVHRTDCAGASHALPRPPDTGR